MEKGSESMKINIRNCFQKNVWITLVLACFLIYSVTFFLTANPFSAIHSGRAAYDSTYKSDAWTINTAYSMFLILVLVTLVSFIYQNRKLFIYRFELIYMSSILLISFINGSIFDSTRSAIFNLVSILCVFRLVNVSLSMRDNNERSVFQIIKLWRLVSLLLVFGIMLAIMQPNRYGLFNLDFSRTSRGEITYWLLLGLHIWGIVLSLTVYTYCRKKSCLFIIGIIIFTQAAFANRMALIIICMPVLFYLLFMTNTNKKIVAMIVLAVFVYSQWDAILGIFTAGNDILNISGILNGRDELWLFYIDRILEHPIIGCGLNLSSSASYTGGAFSEIGVLKIFGEYGIIIGGLQLFAIIVSFAKALKILINAGKSMNDISAIDLTMSFLVIANFSPFIIESYARILSFTDLFAWFSLYYVFFRIPLLAQNK